ncbi:MULTISPECIES: MBOAT family O-acyltransferase [unclassified Pseudoalteromonas]|uniref:MBOAT family O-acyltransferase n=1 Tax=unclassified Pseudoalteromonas TaxID=194690 RepID=UPI0006940A67|nr:MULTISPECIES: MBOAT family O-acyltransferase [unclassified Pseudoalteromonas]
MKIKLTLSQYVKRRNSVPLGGSGSFSEFWKYWNQIWGYYLSRYIFSPLNARFYTTVAVILTFITSGLLHDFAASLIKMKLIFVTTPWLY